MSYVASIGKLGKRHPESRKKIDYIKLNKKGCTKMLAIYIGNKNLDNYAKIDSKSNSQALRTIFQKQNKNKSYPEIRNWVCIGILDTAIFSATPPSS